MTHDIISVGSAAIDIFLASTSKHIEIEQVHDHQDVCMPIGEKIIINNVCTGVGGSGINTSTSFSRLGFNAAYLGKLGKDLHADLLLKHLDHENIDFLGKQGTGPSGLSVVLSKLNGNRTILVYKGSNDQLAKNDVPWNKLKPKWFYFGSMLGKSWKTQCQIARHAKKNNIPVLYNPSHYVAKEGMTKLKPVLDATRILIVNKEEARSLTSTKKNIPELLKTLQKKIPLIVITDGANGAYAYDGSKQHRMVPKNVKITDTTGAGDAFSSAFLAAIMRGKDIPTALRWGAAQSHSVLGCYGATNNLLNKTQLAKKAKTAVKTCS